jgi:NADP-dependent 3-hydroxy acid dehydrogenase YdfG
VLQLEVSERKAVAQAAADILRRHRRIDILINSAGTNVGKRNLHNMSVEGWDEVVAINLSGLFYCCHAVLPAMRAQKDGLVINISSWAGRYASTLTGPAYNASKARRDRADRVDQRRRMRARHPRDVVAAGQVATPILRSVQVPPPREDREECCRRRTSARPSCY